MYDNKKDALVTEKNAALRKSVSSAHLGIAASECIDKSTRAMLRLCARKRKKNMNQSKIVERKERREKKRPENREARERQQRRVA